CHLQQLQERFQSQRSRTNRILVKVGLEEPLLSIDRFSRLNRAQSVRCAVGNERVNFIDHAQWFVEKWSLFWILKSPSACTFTGSWLVHLDLANADLLR